MRAPSIQRTAALSALLHLAVLVLSIILIKYSKNIVMPSPYTVSLVSPGNAGRTGPSVSRSGAVESPVPESEKQVKEDRKMSDAGKNDATKKKDQKDLDNTIAAIAAKKKVEHLVKLRSVIGGSTSQPKRFSSGQTTTKGAETGRSNEDYGGSYMDIVVSKIANEIDYFDTDEKQLTTIIVVKILKDGKLEIQKVESSGNRRFDNAAKRAIEKASPVLPPANERIERLGLHPAGYKEL